jgi:transcriptional regulator with XRE-family HTH domain
LEREAESGGGVMVERALQDGMLRQRIGARVFFLRKRRGITAFELAGRAGLHRNTIYRIESGLSLCSLVQIWRIASVLGVEIEDFVRDSPSKVHFSNEPRKGC